MKHLKFVILFLSLSLISSCVSYKKSTYLQGKYAKSLEEIEKTHHPTKSDYLVKPNDNLYIRVTSTDERTSAFLNFDLRSTNGRIDTPMAAALAGYRVNMEGSINFPFMGEILVSGLTLTQVRDKIQEAVSEYLDDSSVDVKLLNDNISIIGEVTRPGRFLLYTEEINILEAISMAGDMTDFANRKEVRLIRNEGDVPQIITINTLDENIIFSSYYHMKPGDIIYVAPRRLKSWDLSAIPINLTLTFLNTAILIYTASQINN